MIDLLTSKEPQIVKLREIHLKFASGYLEMINENLTDPNQYIHLKKKSPRSAKALLANVKNLAKILQSIESRPLDYPALLSYTHYGLKILDGNKRTNISLALNLPCFALLPEEHDYNK